MPCRDCPKRETCSEICPMLSAKLPSIEDGSFSKFLYESHQTLREVADRMEFVRIMTENRRILKGRDAQIFDYFYNNGMSAIEIAWIFSTTHNHVKASLKRSYANIRHYLHLNSRNGKK